MKNKLGSDPAYPVDIITNGKDPRMTIHDIKHGMSQRLLLAGMAMQGICASNSGNGFISEQIASRALKIADELLKQEAE